MDEKEKLRSMLDNLINDNGEEAELDFHSYLQGKMQDELGMVAKEPEDESSK